MLHESSRGLFAASLFLVASALTSFATAQHEAAPADFVEVPGEREFSGFVIAPPLQPEQALERGFSDAQRQMPCLGFRAAGSRGASCAEAASRSVARAKGNEIRIGVSSQARPDRRARIQRAKCLRRTSRPPQG